MTNFEKIKSDIQNMTFDEMASPTVYNYGYIGFTCEKCAFGSTEECLKKENYKDNCRSMYRKWLASEVSNGEL